MKQLIVLISTIMLGILISGIVLDFGDDAKQMKTTVNSGITAIEQEFTSAAAINVGGK